MESVFPPNKNVCRLMSRSSETGELYLDFPFMDSSLPTAGFAVDLSA